MESHNPQLNNNFTLKTDNVSLTDLPNIILNLKNEGLKFDSVFDLLALISNTADYLFSHGANDEGEDKESFYNRISPLIVENLVAFKILTQVQGQILRDFLKKTLNFGIDAIEEVLLTDLNQDGQIGFYQADDANQLNQVNLLTHAVELLEQLVNKDLNQDGNIGFPELSKRDSSSVELPTPVHKNNSNKGCFSCRFFRRR